MGGQEGKLKKKELAAALAWERTVNRILSMIYETSEPILPTASKVILNEPATIVKWNDGTKTVSKVREGDEWDPLFGIIACAVRKVTRNRGHAIDANEDLIGELAASIRDLDDVGGLIDYCLFVLDVLTILEESADLWYDQLGPSEPEPMPVAAATPPTNHMAHESSTKEDLDAVRQQIRNLIDAGEL